MKVTKEMVGAAKVARSKMEFMDIEKLLNAALQELPGNWIDGDAMLDGLKLQINILDKKATDCKQTKRTMLASLHSAQRDGVELVAADIKSGKYNVDTGV